MKARVFPFGSPDPSRARRARHSRSSPILSLFCLLLITVGLAGLGTVPAGANVIVHPDNPGSFQNSPAITVVDPPQLVAPRLAAGYMQYPSLTSPFGVMTSYSPDGGATWLYSTTPPASGLGFDTDPAMASSATSVYFACASSDAAVWGPSTSTGIFVSTSPDSGVTYLPPVPALTAPAPAPFWLTEPKIDSDFHQTSPYVSYTYVVCEADLTNGINSDILFAQSPDHNNSWPVQAVVNDNAPTGTDLALWPDLDIGNDGSVVVGWLDMPLGAQHQGVIYVDRTLDAGGSFGTDVPATTFWTVPTWLNDQGLPPSPTHNAFSYCVVAVDPSNPQRIGAVFAGDPDTGPTPAAEAKLDGDGPDSGQARLLNPFSGASNIATGANYVHTCWMDDRGPQEVMYTGTSTLSGFLSWPGTEIVVSTQTNPLRGVPNNANIKAAGNNVYITWDEFIGTDINHFIYFNRSLDDGTTWLPNAVHLDFSLRDAHTPIVAGNHFNNVCVAWLHETLAGTTDLYVNYSMDGGTTFQPSEIRVPTSGRDVLWHDIDAVYDYSGPTHVVYVTWAEDDGSGLGSEVYFAVSYTGGATWGAPVRMDLSPQGTNSFAPKICGSANGDIHITWVDDRNGSYDIYANSGFFFGINPFIGEQQVESNGPGTSRDYYSQIECVGTDVFIVYESDRGPNPASEEIWIAVSNNSGFTYTETRLDTGDPLSNSHSVYPRLALGGTDLNDFVFVVWQDDRNMVGGMNGHDVYGNISYDDGATWMVADYRVDTGTQPGIFDSETPHVSGGPNAFFLWRDTQLVNGHEIMANAFYYGPDEGDIFYTESLDGGATWSHPPLRVNDDTTSNDQSHPSVDIKPNGIVDVIWYDKRNDQQDQNLEVMFATLLPGQPVFGPNIPVTNTILTQPPGGWWIGDYNGLMVDDCLAHTVWTDPRRDAALGDIYYANLENPDLGPTGACCLPDTNCAVTTECQCAVQGGEYMGDGEDCDPNPCVTPVPEASDGRFGLSCYPNPFNPRTVISYELAVGRNVQLDVYDLRGRLVRSLVDLPFQAPGRYEVTFDGRDATGRILAAGMYFAHLRSGQEAASTRLVLLK